MGYNPLRNWKYDSGPRRIQSGPAHEGYKFVGSGVMDVGSDYGVLTAGPPNASGEFYAGPFYILCEDSTELSSVFLIAEDNSFIVQEDEKRGFNPYISTAWRSVPPAPSGYWNDYEYQYYAPSGATSIYQGYRVLSVTTIAGAKVATNFGPQPGLRDSGKYLYFGGFAPDTQAYDPFKTPAGNTSAQGWTGGGNVHGIYSGPALINPTNDDSGSRAAWIYQPPAYCRTHTELVRATEPGSMSVTNRYIYRGKAGQYVTNLGGPYYQLGEGIRNLIHTYSSTVNSSNQKNV
jgi:hypothetical protein